MQIVRQMGGNLLRMEGRTIIRSNGQNVYGGVKYHDTFLVLRDADPNDPNDPGAEQVEIMVGSQITDYNSPLPPLLDFDNYTVTVTIDITPNN